MAGLGGGPSWAPFWDLATSPLPGPNIGCRSSAPRVAPTCPEGPAVPHPHELAPTSPQCPSSPHPGCRAQTPPLTAPTSGSREWGLAFHPRQRQGQTQTGGRNQGRASAEFPLSACWQNYSGPRESHGQRGQPGAQTGLVGLGGSSPWQRLQEIPPPLSCFCSLGAKLPPEHGSGQVPRPVSPSESRGRWWETLRPFPRPSSPLG